MAVTSSKTLLVNVERTLVLRLTCKRREEDGLGRPKLYSIAHDIYRRVGMSTGKSDYMSLFRCNEKGLVWLVCNLETSASRADLLSVVNTLCRLSENEAESGWASDVLLCVYTREG